MTDVYKRFTDAEKYRVEDIDSAINGLQQETENISKFIRSTERGWALLEAKIKKERLGALTALSKYKVMIAKKEVQLQLAESDNKENQQNSKVLQSEREDKSSLEQKYRRRQPAISSYRRSRESTSSFGTYGARYRTKSHSKSSNIPKEPCKTPLANLILDIKENGSNKIENPIEPHCSASSSTHIDSNRSLAASIIAEFEKPFLKTIDLPKASHSTDHSLVPLNRLPQKRKIYPVSNIEVYKKPYTHQSLSYGSHVLYNPNANEKRPLHSGDPRTYYYKDSNVNKLPLKLPVPQMWNRLAPTPGKYVPQCIAIQNTTITTTSYQSHQFLTNSNKHCQQKYVPVATTLKNVSSTAELNTLKKPENGFYNSGEPSKNIDSRHDNELYFSNNNIHASTRSNKSEHKNIYTITPPQNAKKEKHICVPIPPIYNNIKRNLYSMNIKSELSGSPKVEF